MPTENDNGNTPNGPMAINLDSGVTLTKGGDKGDAVVVTSKQLKGGCSTSLNLNRENILPAANKLAHRIAGIQTIRAVTLESLHWESIPI